MHPCLLPLDSELATLPWVGGKAANLARLVRAGFPVPGGFIVTVAAYQEYVAAARLAPAISAALAGVDLADMSALEAASASIRALFTPAALPQDLATALRTAYRELDAPPVAVRSSATAEDLPDMSFAGQQDTYLNVQGDTALLRAVVDCWSSLWTARAIGYRARQGIPGEGLALAVVVQRMVPADAAGVLFTANPLTGLRTETVIDAALGLGEALVSGQVEPDRYLVDTSAGRILEKKLGAKAVSSVSRPGGGVEWRTGDASRVQALPDRHILALAELGRRVEAEYGFPQDIEWALAGEEILLLQARPITSLFPVPAGLGPRDLRAMFSFGAVQGMLDPMTPLGQDMIALLGTGFASLYGYTHYNETNLSALRRAGERLWLDITSLLRNPVGGKVIRFVLDYIEPSTAQAIRQIGDDPRLRPTERHLRLATLARMLRGLAPIFARLLLTLAAPERRIRAVQRTSEAVFSDYRDRVAAIRGSRDEKLARRLATIRLIVPFLKMLAYQFVPAVAGAMSMWTLLGRLASQLDRELDGAGRNDHLSIEVTRGAANNVTTQMDLLLWQTARTIRADASSAALFRDLPVGELAARYRSRSLPPAALDALDSFMARYGMRGLAEIDLGRPRWSEEPAPLLDVLASYLRIERDDMAPDAVFARGQQAGQQAAQELARAARAVRGGWFKARLIRFAARRVRLLMGVRESPKFFAVRFMGIARQALLASGQEYADAGLVDRPDDLFFLSLRELEAFARGEARDWKALIAGRRALYQRELLRRQIPRLLLSDGRAFYDGILAPAGAAQDTLAGDPVSPGLVEGRVRVVLDPRGASLAPGEILVCPGTDPSWTPLFLAAGGLVMEVGGMMTHGAVVAREYGIPAIVGVHQATTRLQTGRRVRVNGSTGEITLLD